MNLFRDIFFFLYNTSYICISLINQLLPRAKRELLKSCMCGNYVTKFFIQQFMQYDACVLVYPIALFGRTRRWHVIESFWTTARWAEPYLLIRCLFIYHVNAVIISQIHRQHSILELNWDRRKSQTMNEENWF